MGDLNSETTEQQMEHVCVIYHLKNLAKEPTCFKKPNKASSIDLLLTNCSRSFQDKQVVETGS